MFFQKKGGITLICPQCSTEFDEAYGVCPKCAYIVSASYTAQGSRSYTKNNSGSGYQQSQYNNKSFTQQASTNIHTKNDTSEILKIVLPIATVVIIIVGILCFALGKGLNADNEASAKPDVEYTAEELADKSLDDIISIMQEDFSISSDTDDLIHFTGPCVYIYNEDVLPGFKVYIEEAYDDWDEDDDNLNRVKEKLLDDDYDDYSLIVVEEDALVDDDIRVGMCYDELTEYLGEFCCSVGDEIEYEPNDECIMLFSNPEDDTEDFEENGFTLEDMRSHNLELTTALIYPGFEPDYIEYEEDDTTEETTEFTTEIPTTKEPETTKITTTEKQTTQPVTVKETTTKKVETTAKKQDKLIFASMADNYIFSSGAGGWSTVFTLADDGSFSGEYSDTDMGDTGPEYPNGTKYISIFRGKFTEPRKIDDYTYEMELQYLETENLDGEIFYSNDIRHICVAPPYGFHDAKKFYIYLPGKPISTLPDSYLTWVYIDDDGSGKIPDGFYGIYNQNGDAGFQSTD